MAYPLALRGGRERRPAVGGEAREVQERVTKRRKSDAMDWPKEVEPVNVV